MEVKCTSSPIFEATEEPQSSGQALGSSSDARRHHGSQPCPPALQGRGAPSPLFPHRTPRSAHAGSPALHSPLANVLLGSLSFIPRASLLLA